MRDPTVLVVGGGVSGLMSARKLAAAGVDVTVLEAGEVAGGRTKGVVLQGEAVDVGGQWLGVNQPELSALIAELGLPTFDTSFSGDAIWALSADQPQRGHANDWPLSPDELTLYRKAAYELEELARTVPVERPWDAPDAFDLDGRTVSSWLVDHFGPGEVTKRISFMISHNLSGDPRRISMLWFLMWLRTTGGLDVVEKAEKTRVKGGMYTVAQKLAEDLGKRVLTGQRVLSLSTGDKGVTVATIADTFTADYGIVAMNPADAGNIRYDRGLPAMRSEIHANWQQDPVIKFHAVYSRPFWRDQGLNGHYVSAGSGVSLTIDESPAEGGAGILVGFLTRFGRSKEFSPQLTDLRIDRIKTELSRVFGTEAGRPLAVNVKDWLAEDELIGGGVGWAPPGLLTSCGLGLRTPCGRLHWAGSETSTSWPGFITGAIQSGIRAAGEILLRIQRDRAANLPA